MQCLKYLTTQAADLKRIDKMNNLFLARMCGKDPVEAEVVTASGNVAGSGRPASSDEPKKGRGGESEGKGSENKRRSKR